MNEFLIYLLEASVCLGFFYGLYRFVLVKEKKFNLNRGYLLLSVLASFTFPALSIDFGKANILNSATVWLEPVGLGNVTTNTVFGGSSMSEILIWAYLIGVIIALTRFFAELVEVIKLYYSGYKVGENNGIKVIDTLGNGPTGSFFNTVFWNEQGNLSIDQKNSILEHESVHAREGHSVDVVLIELAGVILWFNPFVYLIRSSIKANHEYIADSKVATGDIDSYLHLLATQALVVNKLSLKSFFSNTQIINRMRMLKSTKGNSSGTRYLLIAPLMLALFIAFSCESSLTAQPEELANIEQAALEDVKTEVTKNAEPEGGMTALYEYMINNMQYPEQAKKLGVEGKVYVEFIVDKSGNVTNVNVLKGIGAGCDAEAKRVIEGSPKWVPGNLNGKVVNQKLVLPVTFALE